MERRYAINEIFYSLQGEGWRAGAPSVFVRFAGCNLECSAPTVGFDCDTEYVSGRPMTSGQILDEMGSVGGACRWAVITGGEPLLQFDEALAQALRSREYAIAIETNGTVSINDAIRATLGHIACSPKTAEHTLRIEVCDELRYVRRVGQAIPKPSVRALRRYISPAWSPEGLRTQDLVWCINLCKENPEWSLSLQQHKTWGVR